MPKTVLIAGKELPSGSDFASGASLKGRTSLITVSPSDKNPVTVNGVKAVTWNRSSVLSAKSVVLNSLNIGGNIDEAVLLFDEEWYASGYVNADGVADSIRIVEELITGYQYLTDELINRFHKKVYKAEDKKTSKLVFIYKPNHTLCDAVTNASLKLTGASLSSPYIASAGAAFKAFAENTAASLCESEDVIPVLVNCDPSNEMSRRDNTLSTWLCDYLDAIDSLKRSLTSRQKTSWVKAGAKSPGGFGLFS